MNAAGFNTARYLQLLAADPVNTATGAFAHPSVDIGAPGSVVSFAFGRVHVEAGVFGVIGTGKRARSGVPERRLEDNRFRKFGFGILGFADLLKASGCRRHQLCGAGGFPK